MSIITFVFVTSLVLWGAEFTLNKCLTDTPNTAVIASLFSRQSPALAQITDQPSILGAITGVQENLLPTPLPIIKQQLNCRQSNEGYSIINYLNEQGLEYDLGYRSQLAIQYGITDYRGTPEQNMQLLTHLRLTQLQSCLASE